ncbi:MAG TPA: dienelactone hydrolase family protein [Caldimonas sp.]|nr:dienelactone hydrolase family protein [Caldimonas sp.]
MIARCFRIVRIAGLALATVALAASPALAADDDAGSAPAAQAPKMISLAPPSGSGPVVVVVSGDTGTGNYEYFASDVARLGYSTVLVDGKDVYGRGIEGGAVLRRIIAEALAAPTARPGKVVVIGFSLGGGASLVYATAMQRSVAGVIVFYPLTRVPVTPQRLAERMRVPVLMFAGGADHYHDCCLIETAHAIEAAASEAKAPFELVVYPDADHGFSIHGRGYRAADMTDAWKRTRDRLAQLSPLS